MASALRRGDQRATFAIPIGGEHLLDVGAEREIAGARLVQKRCARESPSFHA
jgi:hypothetical protein